MDTQICSTCRQDLPLESFHRASRARRGRQYQCKKCKTSPHNAALQKKAARLWYERNRTKTIVRAKAWRKANPKSYARSAAKLQKKSPHKFRAHSLVWVAISRGELERGPCVRCGQVEGVHGHHEDYSKPLEVIWLCPKHHHARHREIREQ